MSKVPEVFTAAEHGRKLSKRDFKKAVPALRLELVQLQRQLLQDAGFPVIVLVAGLNSAGRSETVNLLNEWMDPRFLMTEAYGPATREELAHPPFWRYWRDLPPNGRIGLFMNAWYTQAMIERSEKKMGRKAFAAHLERVLAFEKLLADDGAVILKLWMHLEHDRQAKRLKKLIEDPLQRWRVTPLDRELCRRYDRYLDIAGDAIRRTSTAEGPWTVIDGADPRHRSLEVGRVVRDALQNGLDRSAGGVDAQGGMEATAAIDSTELVVSSLLPSLERSVLAHLDMSLSVSKADYVDKLAELQSRVNGLARRARESKLPVILVFEGWDAAGKGGAVRRLTAAMDARDYRVIPIAAPSDEERAHHYLWRFWRHLGRAGRATIFDRSWYGRVLVERVEGFADEQGWRRAYDEINDFEDQLLEHGSVVLKFWIHVTAEEQLARFKERQSTPHKRWKLTDEDWRNRGKRELYERAVEEMIVRTSTASAPWTLVEGNCKYFARLKVLRTAADALEAALGEEAKGKRRKS